MDTFIRKYLMISKFSQKFLIWLCHIVKLFNLDCIHQLVVSAQCIIFHQLQVNYMDLMVQYL